MSEQSASVGGGMTSNIFAIIGGVVCIFGGIMLAGLEARGNDSMIEAIANGMGIYFIGKGIYMISMVSQLRGLFRGLMPKSEQ